MYHVATCLRDTLKTAKSVENWPPRADDLTIQQCEEVVPVKLFNFLAWCTGASDVICLEDCVEVPDGMKNKLLSICQDLISLSSRGRKLTPKHLALGMAVRHLTGCSTLIGLLNGLGHCTSHSLVLQHDTALALQQLEGVGLPP